MMSMAGCASRLRRASLLGSLGVLAACSFDPKANANFCRGSCPSGMHCHSGFCVQDTSSDDRAVAGRASASRSVAGDGPGAGAGASTGTPRADDGAAISACLVVSTTDECTLSGTPTDDDCDGSIDEDCMCVAGRKQDCYPANPASLGVGRCR